VHTHTQRAANCKLLGLCVCSKKKNWNRNRFSTFHLSASCCSRAPRGRLTLESVIWGWIAAELTVRALKGSCVPVWGGVKRGGNAEEEGESSVHLIVVFLDCTRFA